MGTQNFAFYAYEFQELKGIPSYRVHDHKIVIKHGSQVVLSP